MSYYLAIVGTKDNPIFQMEFGSWRGGGDGVPRFREDIRHMNQFIVHSALDIVEEVQWTSSSCYMKNIDRFNNSNISVFLTAGNIKIMLLHESKQDDAIRTFFQEVYDLYVKCLLNPFYTVDAPITSPAFEVKVRAAARKYL
ncbi:TRAPP subunit [Saitoella coloradoensis]